MAPSPHTYPEFACQPLFFNQHRFRIDLASKPELKVFKDAIAGANAHFERRFDEGEDVRHLVAERATLVDLLLHYAWHKFAWGNDLSLIAVGGYGRGELHPHSDIDILILLDNSAHNKYQDDIQRFITFLWDIGLAIGSSVRTLDECVNIAYEDVTVVTNILEARRIAGNDQLRDELLVKTDANYMWSLSQFYNAKVKEQHARHAKHNNTEYNLEPNVKNSPGGLRDIQTINWIAKRFYAVHTLRQLEGKNFFTESEFGLLRKCEAFLWKVRYALHTLTQRPEERLLFEYQRELARRFGYRDDGQRLAVEQFMHEYYRSVTALRQLNDVLLRVLDERIHHRELANTIEPLSSQFQLRDGYVEVTHENVFEQDPSALLEIFLLMGRNSDIKGVQSDTIRLIRESRYLVDKQFQAEPRNRERFLKLLKMENGPVTQLKRMTRYGILGRYLPAFGQIIGQMQHDLFHRYTVDAHTLLVLENIREFLLNRVEREFSEETKVVQSIEQPELLYIAALFHDIGKGRGGDHSLLGAVDAEQFCIDHGLTGRETRLVKWLVEKHLLMSFFAQKKDISDPDIIHEFAVEVGDILHLDYLYALTVADMCGTNPEIWNSWRASLMHHLYTETKRALRRGLNNVIDQQEIVDETQRKALAILAAQGIDSEAVRRIWADMWDDYFVRESFTDIAWQTQAILQHQSLEPLILIRDSKETPWRGITQIFVRVKDVSNVFVAAATALAQLNLNIQDARLYNTKSGYTVDTFYVLDENYQAIDNSNARKTYISSALKAELSLVDSYSEIVRRRTPRELKQFATPTRTSIYNDSSATVTVLEVISPDRPGLLATIGRIFMDFGIQLQNAKISTLGERVEDIFFITDADNRPLGDPEFCAHLQTTICKELDLEVGRDI